MDLPKRKSNRLSNYNYSENGAYFITICTYERKCILSSVGAIHESPVNNLTDYGKIVGDVIKQIPNRFNVKIINYVIMPNHIHMIIIINNNERALHETPLQERSTISKLVGFLKMNCSKKIHEINPNEVVWQRSFHDHVIRNEKEYQKNMGIYIE